MKLEKGSKTIKGLALSLAQVSYTPISFFLALPLIELAEYAEIATSKKP